MSEEYPECEKLNSLAGQRNTIVNFIDWLAENDMTINSTVGFEDFEWTPQPIRMSNEELAHKFLGIDDVELEKERRQMLENC